MPHVRITFNCILRILLIWITTIALSSCNPDSESFIEAGSYWNSNDLVRMQIKGNVKTIETGNRIEYYNPAGYLDSVTSGITCLQKCMYVDNMLTYSKLIERNKNDIVFVYTYSNNNDIYIPLKFNQNTQFTFIKGLYTYSKSFMGIETSPFGYIFQKINDTSTIVVTLMKEKNLHEYITYSGKFPVSSFKQYPDSAPGIGAYSAYSYSPLGELCRYEYKEQHSNSSTTTSLTYSQIGKYLLNDTTIVHTKVGTNSSIVKTVQTFNQDGFLLRSNVSNGDYSNYTYYLTDSRGNWTWRTCLNKTGSLTTSTTQSRIISYYD